MNRTIDDPRGPGETVLFAVCAAALLCGAAAGAAAARSVTDPGAVRSLGLAAGERAGFLRCLWEAGRFHAAVFLLSFFVLGAPVIPAVCLTRGFLLGFSSAAAARFGGSFALSAVAFGPACLVSVPCLLVLAPGAMARAGALFSIAAAGRGNARPLYTAAFFRRCAVCAAVLCAAAATEAYLIPGLIPAVIP